MSASLTLYSAPGTCALAVHIALREAGADAHVVHLDFATNEQQGADYLAINPKGRVPALRTEQGVLTETPALLAYIAQRYPQARLAPLDDAYALARVQEFTSWLASTYHVAHAHKRRGARWVAPDETAAIAAMQAHIPRAMTAHAQAIEAQLARSAQSGAQGDEGGSPWIAGPTYSVADIYLYALGLWLEGDGVDTTALPCLLAHRARVATRPAVQRALAEAQAAVTPATA